MSEWLRMELHIFKWSCQRFPLVTSCHLNLFDWIAAYSIKQVTYAFMLILIPLETSYSLLRAAPNKKIRLKIDYFNMKIYSYIAAFRSYHLNDFVLRQLLELSKQPLTAHVCDNPCKALCVSVGALATDVSVFTNKATMWIMQTGRPDQPSDSMRLHWMWPAQVGFICHACFLSQERHRIISSINRWWWLIGLLLNKHGNDPLTLCS